MNIQLSLNSSMLEMLFESSDFEVPHCNCLPFFDLLPCNYLTILEVSDTYCYNHYIYFHIDQYLFPISSYLELFRDLLSCLSLYMLSPLPS